MLQQSENLTWKELLRPKSDIFDFTLDGYFFLIDPTCTILIPENTPLKLQKMLLAAIKCYVGGYGSMDYVLRIYGTHWKLSSRDETLNRKIRTVLLNAKTIYQSVSDKRSSLKDLPDIPGLFAAGAALMRLFSSFQVASFLIQHGLNFEAMCINKLILEQIAWAYAVHTIENGDFLKKEPTSCIKGLKQLCPTAGKLYGELNRNAHIHPSEHHRMVEFSQKGASVILRNNRESLIISLYLMILADIYGICMDSIYRQFFSSLDFITVDPNGTIKPRKDRPSIALIHKTQTEINRWVDRNKSKINNKL